VIDLAAAIAMAGASWALISAGSGPHNPLGGDLPTELPPSGYHSLMTKNDDELPGSGRPPVEEDNSAHPEQEHPEQEAHGGSMAPGLVDDTGHPLGDSRPEATAD
jgi:hypothetical protein